MIEQLAVPTIASRLTAEIPAAIATIAIRGPRVCELVCHFTQLPTSRLMVGRIRYAKWQIGPAAEQLSEQIVLCRTSEESVEIHCHGGPAVCHAILQDLAAAGCEIASQHDWPSDFKCPIAAAAEHDLLHVTTDRAAAILLDQMNGALRQAIEAVRSKVLARELTAAQTDLQGLLSWSELGQRLSVPWRIVLAGPPNVGKSSLMNALVGSQQSIVHPDPGTTRDWIECHGAIDGWPVSFTDTAGIRDTLDEIESAGVARSSAQLVNADLAVFVVDASQGWQEQHAMLLELAPAKTVVAWNKVDLLDPHKGSVRPPGNIEVIPTSALKEIGIIELLETITSTLVPRVPSVGMAVPFRDEHIQRIGHCCDLLSIGRVADADDMLAAMLCFSPKTEAYSCRPRVN